MQIGLAGVLLPNSAELDLGWGILRPVTPRDERFTAGLIEGQLTSTDEAGNTAVIKYSGDVVLVTDVSYRIKITSDDAQEWPKELRSYQDIESKLESVRLGLLLSSSKQPGTVVLPSWRITEDPLGFGPALSWSDTRTNRGILGRQLSKREARSWRDWTKDVHKHRVASIDIAIRRTLRASAERNDPADVLVDAVIAWENLVGSQQGEPTLRVTAALAWLLQPADPAERLSRRKNLVALYHLRSGVVHGSKILQSADAAPSSEALEVAIVALRSLFADRRDLLADCRDGNERSLKLVLQA